MRTITHQLDAAFRIAIHDALNLDADPVIVPSQNETFGDYQSNAAMGLAKQAKSNPRAVAEQIKSKLKLDEMASEVSIAGPGFINVRLKPTWLAKQLDEMRRDPKLGVEQADHPQIVVVDYSGPNIAKEMHVGHLRSTIIGDAISRVLEFHGDNIIRRNHIGDWGTQFGMLIAYIDWVLVGKIPSPTGFTFSRDPGNEPSQFSLEVEDLEQFYRAAKELFDSDSAFAQEARRAVVELQKGTEWTRKVWQEVVEETRRHYQPIYERLNVKLRREHEFGESFYNPLLPRVVEDLKKAGIAEESEGAIAVFVDGKGEGKTPLVIEKTGGGYLYGTTDLAGVRQRIEDLHATRLIYTHDSRQANHFRQVFETARKAGWAGPNVQLDYAPFGTMLGPDGKPFKTRSGETVKLKDLLDEAEERARKIIAEKNPELPAQKQEEVARAVGIGAVKYADLSKDRISDYVFDWDKMLSFDGNTAPYLQNAYVRIKSIFRKSGIGEVSSSAPINLGTSHEVSLAKHLLRFGEVIDLVARELKPHHLATYLYELATKFHAFYEHCPVLQSDEPTRSSRLALCDITARTLACGLDLLGIEHPEQM
jgi:arginyl-tRNA synthetase